MKTPEDEAFDDIARKQGAWGGGYQAKRQMAADKMQEPVRDLDGHVVREPRKRVPKPKAQPAQEPVHCQCTACKDGILHASDCAIHNGPAYPAGPCDCGVAQEQDWKTLPKKDAPLVNWAKNQTPPRQRPWVGLTEKDIERIKLMTYEKETNADGEEQEAVNIDWLIKTTEHFCKEKNS